MRTLHRAVAAIAASAFAGPCFGQCAPYFFQFGTTSYPYGSPKFGVADEGSEHPLYRVDTFTTTPALRLGPSGWEALPMSGIATGQQLGLLFPLVEGDGARHIYVTAAANTTYPVGGFYRWSGTAWESAGMCWGACSGFEMGSIGYDVNLIDFGQGAQFYSIGSRHLTAGTFIARWDGSQWEQIGHVGDGDNVYGMVSFNDGTGPALFVLGEVSSVDGVPMSGMAKWDGQSWSNPVASGIWAQVEIGSEGQCVASLGDGPALYTWVRLTGHSEVCLGKFDGHTWTYLGEPDPRPPPQSPSYIQSIASFDDGRGPALFISGIWESFSGVPSHGLVRWDPVTHAFEAVGDGNAYPPDWMGEFKSGRGWALFFGDCLRINGGNVPSGSSMLVACRPGSCEGDCDGDGILSVGDFTCFMQKYAAGDPYANCDGSSTPPVFNVADFICFMQRFGRGCR
jgi:hypothetical protein